MRSCGQVLSIAKLRVGQEAYQLSGVAESLDDYYTGVGEAAGRWVGAGAPRLGLTGEVDADDLRAVLAGLAPGTGGLTPNGETMRAHPRRVPGFDLTFKAPKSVSVLYAVSDDPGVQGAIIEAGDSAVAEAIGWLEREAIRVRRGTGNARYLDDLAARDPEAAEQARLRSLPARGVVAASFRHRTSRAGDPLLHWHNLVANLAEGPDGRWTAFVHPDLYHAARAAGDVFQAVMRAELTERLGLEWRPGRHVPEIAGVPQALCDQFSKRSAEIDAWLEATGTSGDRAGRQAAVLATRRNKPEVEQERFDAVWKAEATAAGWGPEQAAALLAELGIDHDPTISSAVDDAQPRPVAPSDPWMASLTRSLTESDATFSRADVVRAVAARLGQGATMSTIERVTATVLAHDTVIAVDTDHPRWTTRELLTVERRFLDAAQLQVDPIEPAHADTVIDTMASLGDDQAAAVRTLAASRDAVSVLVGPAGTGKTYTLDALRQVLVGAGHQVIGAAPSARAAHELTEGAHLPARTLHRLLGAWGRGQDLPNASTVLIVDEAAMAGIRDLEAVVTRTVQAGGRVVLVGDHHQLPEVTTGGGFAALATDPDRTVATLVHNRRQTVDWERDALRELRDGNVAAAVAAYRSHDRVTIAADRTELFDIAARHWFDGAEDGARVVLIGGTNDTVNALNRTVRNERNRLGQLGPTLGTWAGRDLAVGDHVVARVNDYRATATTGADEVILNGQTGIVTAGTDTSVTVRLDDDRTVILGADYLAAGGVDHAYALTAHRAQGGTWDRAIAVGTDGLYREAGYLVLSRGRDHNQLVVTAREIDDLDRELSRHDSPLRLPDEDPDIDNDLEQRLRTSRAKQLAHTIDPDAATIAELADSHDLATLERLARTAQQVEHSASAMAGGHPDHARRAIERLTHTAEHATAGGTVKALDRHNIGTITAVDDHAGTVDVLFVAADGRSAQRTLSWDEIHVLDAPHDAAVPAERIDTLRRLREPHEQVIAAWNAHAARHGHQPSDATRYRRAADQVIDRAAARLAATEPTWLTRSLGPRPTHPSAAHAWDDAVRNLATHRARHHVDDPHHPLGPTPDQPDARVDWQHAARQLAAARTWLHTHQPIPEHPITRQRSLDEHQTRRDELDQILATAPPDCRPLIDRLASGDTLPFDELAELLDDALATQRDRRAWILEHWPHVVEHAELCAHDPQHRAELADTFGDVDLINAPHLARALERHEPWLTNIVSHHPEQCAEPNMVSLLDQIADHRDRWHVDGPDPLGIAATSPEQRIERQLLATALDQHLDTLVVETTIGERVVALEL